MGHKKIYGLGVGILTVFEINEVKGWGMTPGDPKTIIIKHVLSWITRKYMV